MSKIIAVIILLALLGCILYTIWTGIIIPIILQPLKKKIK
jgi:hypothetical protein